ncbi:MAG: radical SAM protein [Ignisphaera sp.]|uniref:Radical SAM protein n=1 Tax=Ignisphaera aggregans TaxID=334771 RepID=A0A7J3MYV2_9CREN
MTRVVFKPKKEFNKVNKKGKPGDTKIGIFIPIPYRAASSSLFMHLAYEYINSLNNTIAYRYVYNIKEDVLESLDQDIDPRHLDALLVSLSFELDYINVAKVLGALNLLPRYRKNAKPLIIAGGIAPTANPLPLTEIVDAVVIGEAENVLDRIVDAVRDDRPLRMLEDINCVAISPFDSKAKRCYVESLDTAFHPVQQVYSPEEEPIYGYGVRIELSRGCPYLCPFCMEGHLFYPFRYRSENVVKDLIENGFKFNTLARRIIFYSLSLFNIPYIDKLLEKLYENGVSVSAPSLRPDHVNEERLKLLYNLGQKTVTIAPEALVKRFSCSIGKCLDIDTILEIIINAYKVGYEHVKMYLITGFPQLNIDEELNSLRILMDRLRIIRRYHFLEIPVNILIPKPWTPYQYFPPIHVMNNADRIKRYRELLKNYSFVRLDAMDSKWGFIQAILAQGDRSISSTIIECAFKSCSPSTLIKLIKSRGNYTYIYTGWMNDPPWTEVVDIGFNPKYFEYRFNYLSSKSQN